MPDPSKPYLGIPSAVVDLFQGALEKTFPATPTIAGARKLPQFLNPTQIPRYIDPVGAISVLTDLIEAPAKKVAAGAPLLAMMLGKKTRASLPSRVVRHEKVTSSFSKPHGLYTSPADLPSPHTAEGPPRFFDVNQEANVLHVDTTDLLPNPRNKGGLAGQSAGYAALQKMIGPEESKRLLFLQKKDLAELLKSKLPKIQWDRYFDTQEMLEAYSGVLARKSGYDAIYGIDRQAPEFSEYVALTKRAFK